MKEKPFRIENRRLARFLFVLVSLLMAGCLQANILMQPFLQGVTPHSVWVLVECDSRDAVTVRYGIDTVADFSSSTKEIRKTTETTFVHAIELTGLVPATRYKYLVSQLDTTSPVFSFFTAVTPGMPFRFAWMAGNHTGTQVFKRIAGLVKSADPMVLLLGGGLCRKDSYESWKTEFFVSEFQEITVSVPYFNTPGPREGWKDNAIAFSRSPRSASGTGDYFSFDYGDLHVVCMNQEIPYHEGSPQFEFIKQDLAYSRAAWKLVKSHAPAYCKGGHGENQAMIEITRKVFDYTGVNLVLSGHSHFYQHNSVNGIVHLVAGSAGAPLQKPVAASYTVKQVKDYNYLIIDVSATRMKIFAYNDRGEVLDFISLDKKTPDN